MYFHLALEKLIRYLQIEPKGTECNKRNQILPYAQDTVTVEKS